MQSPFQAALLFTIHKANNKPGHDAYVCYLKQQRVVHVERLHSLRGHNPTVNLSSVIRYVRHNEEITGVIIGTWVRSTSEYPYAEEFSNEVERQYHVLLEADIKLVDNLRLSETGVYSYYGDHAEPFAESPFDSQTGVCRLY
ncbi:hypothetical protein [Spirosoma foliorum]|uniref:Uncharacterized protein n=1 Tax=Spirosoma foliorum TaxID=2710596 RepID=A0A7G5GUG1_9BACT|nr:hypothetical protein [Spirosoma foliorum]QMW02503.1 hypothetical protein H3H32_32115 [Spirosoma foliorum]